MTRRKHDRLQQPANHENSQNPQSNFSEARPWQPRPNHTKALRKIVVPTVAIAGLLLILGIGYLAIASHPNPIPQSIIQSVSFPLYHPTSEPAGYQFQTSSATSNNGTVFYNLVDSKTKQSIQISQQPMPADFNPQVMFSHDSPPTTIGPLGTVYDLSFKNQSRFLIAAPKSLIFISATPKISNEQLQQVVNGLKTSS